MKLESTSPIQLQIDSVAQTSLQHAKQHYENFPVASILLPKRYRHAVAIIYSFARQADDFADEGLDNPAQRLAKLQGFRDELELIQAYIQPNTDFFRTLNQVILQYKLPIKPFLDLLDAFSQDVVKTRYANFAEVLDYCQRSANPVGTILLHLYGCAIPANLKESDEICTALQLINFYQDIAIDFDKNEGKRRIYLCQDELQQAGIQESDIAEKMVDTKWQAFMRMNVNRAMQLLLQGKPLGKRLPGRLGFELRMIVAGGERIIHKLQSCNGDIFYHRPQLNKWDWVIILLKALFQR
ncbi:MAG: squalene synthase HpnC [Methylophilus sp.]|nr:squalene synthase HpnC [Methylophilus sp.]